MAIVEGVAREKEVLRKDKISEGWWRKFMGRQEDLALRKGDDTAHNRMDAVNSDIIEHYFKLLKETLVKNELLKCTTSNLQCRRKWCTTESEGFEFSDKGQ